MTSNYCSSSWRPFIFANCACWLPANAVCLSRTSRGFRPLASLTPLTFAGRSFVLGNPLPGTVSFLCSPWPVALGPKGLCSLSAHDVKGSGEESVADSGASYIPYDAIHSVEQVDERLRINGTTFVVLASAEQARQLARSVRNLRSAAPKRREKLARTAIRNSLDPDKVATRLDTFHRQAAWLADASFVLFGMTFLFGPLVYYLCATRRTQLLLAWIYLAMLVACWMWTVWCRARARRQIVSEAPIVRVQHLMMTLLSPAAAMRARIRWRGVPGGVSPACGRSRALQQEDARSAGQRALREAQLSVAVDPHERKSRGE